MDQQVLEQINGVVEQTVADRIICKGLSECSTGKGGRSSDRLDSPVAWRPDAAQAKPAARCGPGLTVLGRFVFWRSRG